MGWSDAARAAAAEARRQHAQGVRTNSRIKAAREKVMHVQMAKQNDKMSYALKVAALNKKNGQSK